MVRICPHQPIGGMFCGMHQVGELASLTLTAPALRASAIEVNIYVCSGSDKLFAQSTPTTPAPLRSSTP